MAAIGDGWATDAWIEASWVTGAWLVGAPAVVLQFLQPLRGLEFVEAVKVDGPRFHFRLESSVVGALAGTRRMRQIKSLVRSRRRRKH